MDNKLSRIEFLRLFGAGALSITPFGRSLLSITGDPPVLTTIVVTPPNVNLVVGQNATFTATGKDQHNNTYPISNPVWTTCGGGTLSPNGTSCTYTATFAGSFTITCRQDGTDIHGMSFIRSSSPPVLTTIVVSPANANLLVGQNATFTATGKDQYNNMCTITNPVWSSSGGGTLAPSGRYCAYRATAAGSFTITCTQSGTTIRDTAEIATTNAPAQLTTIVVTPANANLMVGQNETFTATGKDQYNNTYPISSPVWTTSGGGPLSPSGTSCTYMAVEKGRNTITCRQNGTTIQGTANIHTGHHIYLSMVSG